MLCYHTQIDYAMVNANSPATAMTANDHSEVFSSVAPEDGVELPDADEVGLPDPLPEVPLDEDPELLLPLPLDKFAAKFA